MLGRTLQCRIAKGLMTGLANDNADPLTVGQVHVHVANTNTGFMVVVSSENEDEAREIVRRANNLIVTSIAQLEASAETPSVCPLGAQTPAPRRGLDELLTTGTIALAVLACGARTETT